MCGVKGRTRPDKCPTLRAIRPERSRRSGPWRGAAASRRKWMPAIRRRFLRAESSRMSKTARFVLRRSTGPTSRSDLWCAGRTSTRSGLRMEAGWRLFRRETITHSSVVMTSEEGGGQHLNARSVDGSVPKLLTPGNCEVEQWSFTPDKSAVLFNSNCGDVDRRHLWSVKLTGDRPEQWTRGEGNEWSPMMLSDGQTFGYLASDATHPARAVVSDFAAKSKPPLAPETGPKDFPSDQLVVPHQAILHSIDGLEIHGQLFVPTGLKPGENRPAMILAVGSTFMAYMTGRPITGTVRIFPRS